MFFYPFVGKDYANSSPKIMILGESHYCTHATTYQNCSICKEYAEECKQWTQIGLYRIIHEINKNRSHNTYKKFEKAYLNNKLPSKEERISMWDRLVMYNYVQSPVPQNRTSPLAKQFKDSEGDFWNILQTHKPNYVIVWGIRLSNKLPLVIRKTWKKNGYYETAYTLSNGHIVNFLAIYHPSSGFDIQKWGNCIKAFLAKGTTVP